MKSRQLLPFLVVVAAVGLATTARADDRALLRNSSANPYVFVVLDTSGSMNWAPPCSATDYAAGVCNYLCPTGDCWVPRNSDDPASKFRQAKEALAEVISSTPDVNFGFGTYNQDQLAVFNKHWRYLVRATQPSGFITLNNTGHNFPVAGSSEVFGAPWTCNSGSSAGCTGNSAAAFTDFSAGSPSASWDQRRMYELPKGRSNADTVTYYMKDTDNRVYRVQYQLGGGQTPGAASLQATVRVDRCTNTNCTTVSSSGVTGSPQTITFDQDGASQFINWDIGYQAAPPGNGFWPQGTVTQTNAGNTCGGWEAVTDTSSDFYTDSNRNTYDLKWPTTAETDPAIVGNRALMNWGDVLPLDWRTDHRTDLLQRLAPDGSTAAGEGFSVAKYFQNTRLGNEQFLELVNTNQRPLVASGATPLGFTLGAWRTWFTGCDHGSCPHDSGWRDLAAANDADWSCRNSYLLVLTDGDDTCPGRDPCSDTAALRAQFNVKTYVVAFGVAAGGGPNKLQCMASNGGTGGPIYPQNKQQLVNVLNAIFGSIREQAAAFASAAVPSVQAQVADKIYLTSFTPLNSASIWYGHLDTYLKPLPVANGVPDKTQVCSAALTAGCFLWDAQAQLLTQAPTAVQVAAAVYSIGMGSSNRRVYYPEQAPAAGIPTVRHYLLPPPTTPTGQEYDLWTGMGIGFTPGDTTSETNAAIQATNVINFTLEQKQSTINAPDGTTTDITYVLGDIFHSDPQVISNPGNFRYFASDLNGNGAACDDTSTPNHGYRCFFHKHRCRRKMVFVGSNDGQLHVFDSGQFDTQDTNGNPLDCSASLLEPQGLFDNGTGKELFSFVPRPMLAKLRQFATSTSQDWAVDGTVKVDDVFIDPTHSGTPTAADREWRTVLVGGYREGGIGYYALDVTQPDTLNAKLVPQPTNGYVPSCSGDPSLPSSCGPLAFPSELWEFQDTWDEDPATSVGRGFPDLAKTWSVPAMGRILVCEGSNCDPTANPNDLKDHYVAIFGGGLDPGDSAKPFFQRSGNYIYMVDIETGQAIYKQRVDGSVPSELAAVDTDQNGYLDTIYFGTTAGYIYKVDLSTPAVLADTTITEYSTGAAVNHTVKRVIDAAWDPFKIFDTLDATSGFRKPIFYPPSVIFYPKTGQYVIAVGTGNREDLWSPSSVPGRLYVIMDTGFAASQVGSTLPLTEASYTSIPAVFSGSTLSTDNYLSSPPTGMRPGWFIPLDPGERVITAPFALSGILTFTSYIPKTLITTTGSGSNTTAVCAKGGDSHIFTVMTTNANPVQKDDSNAWERYRLVPVFTTNPYTEQSATANRSGSGSGSGSGQNADQLTDSQLAIMQQLKDLYPANCRFANFRIDIKTIRSDTGVELIAPVPVCMVQKNWKEF